MNSKKAALVAASMVVIVALIAIQFINNPVGPSLTFAQVLEPVLKADAVAFDIALGGKEGNTLFFRHAVAIGSRLRETYNANYIVVSDTKEERQLMLDKEKMEAQYIAVQGYQDLGNILGKLKSFILMVKNTPDITVEELGLKRIDGHDAVGFIAHCPKSSLYPQRDLTVWADISTELPIRIEMNIGELRQLIWNIEFEIQAGEELFSMEVPAGYKLTGEFTSEVLGGTEEKFIKGLKTLAESVNEGTFTLCESLDGLPTWLGDLFKKIYAMNLSEEEQQTITQRYLDVRDFIFFISSQGKWTYTGNGVKVGDANTPIFWYRPEVSETYRVIYGDLHVENVPLGSLPQ